MLDPHELMTFEDVIMRAGELIDQKAEILLVQFSKVKGGNSMSIAMYFLECKKATSGTPFLMIA